jgi:putative addiction module CopG family antidote
MQTRKEAMQVHLSKDLERLVQEKMAGGRYRSPAEVISEALRVLDERDQDLEAKATRFKEEVSRRLAAGPATPMDFSTVKRRIREEVEAGKARQPE